MWNSGKIGVPFEDLEPDCVGGESKRRGARGGQAGDELKMPREQRSRDGWGEKIQT